MRLISWNIAGKVKAVRQQIDVLHSRHPDVIALQEVRLAAMTQLYECFPKIGLHYIESTSLAAIECSRTYRVLIASRWPLRPFEGNPPFIPFPERFLTVIIESPFGIFELHTVHIPPGSQYEMIKIETFEGIYSYLAHSSKIPRILCGDFNSPKAEYPDGKVLMWGQHLDKIGNGVTPKNEERWVAGEKSLILDLTNFDMPDVFRTVNGYSVQESSWVRQIYGKPVAHRFDHIFASKSLKPVSCTYLHQFRERGLSDHSPIEAVFEWGRED